MGENEKTVLGTNIRKLRTFYDISSERLGEACGVCGDTVLRWERGDAIPPAYAINRIIEIFNVPPDVLTTKNIKIDDDGEEKNIWSL